MYDSIIGMEDRNSIHMDGWVSVLQMWVGAGVCEGSVCLNDEYWISQSY